MAFTESNLYSSSGNPGAAQNIFTYKTDDNRSTVTASGYFNAARGTLKVNDYIFVRNSAEDYIIRVTSVASAVIQTELLTYLSDLAQTTGWVQITDSTYTSGSPQAITASTRTKLDINVDSVIESQAPFGTTAETFYNSTSKKIFGESSGDSYIFRLQMTVDPATTNGAMDLELDIGGAQGVIFERTTTFPKGSAPFQYTTSNLYYTLGTFQANGGDLYVTPTVNVDIYDISLVITRTHKGV